MQTCIAREIVESLVYPNLSQDLICLMLLTYLSQQLSKPMKSHYGMAIIIKQMLRSLRLLIGRHNILSTGNKARIF